jgi:peptidoglycan hydrolase-like protein with peptidoglycan-binding domain
LRILTVAFSVALFASRGVDAQDPSTVKKSSTTSKSKATRHKSTAKKQVTATAAPKPGTQSAHRRTTSKTTKRTQAVHQTKQQQPTPDRYKEIQQALSDKGYFKGSADGNWGPESVDALKRFQREQNLTEDGKIGSLSLIALGLGPKRTTTPESPEKPVQR